MISGGRDRDRTCDIRLVSGTFGDANSVSDAPPSSRAARLSTAAHGCVSALVPNAGPYRAELAHAADAALFAWLRARADVLAASLTG